MTRYPTLEAISQWLGQGAVHPAPFNLDAAEAVIEEAIMVRRAVDERYTVQISTAKPERRALVELLP